MQILENSKKKTSTTGGNNIVKVFGNLATSFLNDWQAVA